MGWDQHFTLPKQLPGQCRDTDQPTKALVNDLKQRGMLEDTLVVWGGEFGRTSYCQGTLNAQTYGRDHHPRCFSLWMTGAGIKRGFTYGKTDDVCYNVVENPMHVHDLHATMLHLLGIDHEKLTYRFQGRYFRLTDVHGHEFVVASKSVKTAESSNISGEQAFVGVFDLFKIGIGPSSSHSVGPMRAAEMFLQSLADSDQIRDVQRVQVDLYGSLALTGIGHATDIAVLMGLQGEVPDQIEPETVAEKLKVIREQHQLLFAGQRNIPFTEKEDLLFHRKTFQAGHPNTLKFSAFASPDDS
ncbi:unnamed protein product, partial [Symbiodinium sp. CCMP2456]